MSSSIRIDIRVLIAGIGLCLTGCVMGATDESEDANHPYFQYEADGSYYYCMPPNYRSAYNARREYPLLVFLHGSGGAGNIAYLNYLGYRNPDSDTVAPDSTAHFFQTEHPSFVLIPQTPSSWNTSAIIALIERFKDRYRIDESRLYLIGYSMGGSASAALANEYYGYNGSLFAGIVRLAGQSQTVLRDEVVGHSSVWMHIGLAESTDRIIATRDAFAFLKSHSVNEEASEKNRSYYLGGTLVTTKILTRSGIDVAKESEYTGVGHGIVMLPAWDPAIMEWLYEQYIP